MLFSVISYEARLRSPLWVCYRKRYDMIALLFQTAPKVHHNLPKTIITLNSPEAIITVASALRQMRQSVVFLFYISIMTESTIGFLFVFLKKKRPSSSRIAFLICVRSPPRREIAFSSVSNASERASSSSSSDSFI